MKRISLIFGLLAVSCIVIWQGGCQEAEKSVQTPQPAVTEEKALVSTTPEPVAEKSAPAPTAPKSVPETTAPAPAPKQTPDKSTTVAQKAAPKPVDGKKPEIKFDSLIYDLGNIDPESNNFGEYRFTNVGKALLKIIKIKPDCGCTIPTLKKKEYEPGESGVMKVKYHAVARAAPVTRRIVVTTNDPAQPDTTLTLKGRVVERVSYEPKTLNLLLKGGDDKLPKITLTSLDDKPFKITDLKSSANSISAEFDPAVEATKFVLSLQVDKDRLSKASTGTVNFTLTHPAAKSIRIPFKALTPFKVNPPTIIVFDAEPGKPMIRNNVTVLSNYQEDFEIESVKSMTGITKVVKQEKIKYGQRLSLQVTPPDAAQGKRRFTDEITLTVKGGEALTIRCQGFYKRKK